MRGLIATALRGFERKSVGFSPDWADAFTVPAKSGVSVTEINALRCTTALAATRALAQGIAQPTFGLYRRREGDPRAWDEALDHPLSMVLRQPNEWQTSFEFRETLMIHAILTGNGIAFINRGVGGAGKIRELIPILPSYCSIEQQPDYGLIYRLTFTGGKQVTLTRENVLHLKGMSWNSYEGLSAVSLAREAIGLALATEETHARLHSNGARPGGVLTVDGNVDEDDIKAIRAAWNEAQGGIHNSMKTAVLAGGVKWQQLAMNGVDAQHLETRRFQIEEICRGIGIFPVIVGHSDKTATFASVEAFLQGYVTLHLTPWAERLEQAFWRDLLTAKEKREGYEFEIKLRSLERGDTKARTDYYASGIQQGWMTRNDARVEEGFNPLPGLDEPLSALNMGPTSAAPPAPGSQAPGQIGMAPAGAPWPPAGDVIKGSKSTTFDASKHPKDELGHWITTNPTDEEKAAVRAYTETAYRPVNRALRAGVQPDAATALLISQLDGFLDRASAPSAMTVYRGVGSAAIKAFAGKLEKGSVISDGGFLSTTSNQAVAKSFAEVSRENIIMEISVKKGAKVADIASISDNPGEKELLFHRRSSLKVVSFNKKTRVLKMELI